MKATLIKICKEIKKDQTVMRSCDAGMGYIYNHDNKFASQLICCYLQKLMVTTMSAVHNHDYLK